MFPPEWVLYVDENAHPLPCETKRDKRSQPITESSIIMARANISIRTQFRVV
jgi:hypothetical protein